MISILRPSTQPFLPSAITTSHHPSRRSVIVTTVPSCSTKSSPDKSSTDLFVLHEGTVVTITNRLDDWCEVVIADGKKGWLECRKIETI